MDMKVPFNNRYKYRHGGTSNAQQSAELVEETMIIENNLTEGNNDDKRLF
ncbi:MAG: hypothetical protein J6S49_05385 [Erysipelotrichaceae bacterium]|nr:hypothetical protein [Erysipelotrichaceae bacterium]